MKITLPELSLVTLIGISGSGKSSFAKKHFKPTEVLSSDTFRGMVSDDENDQTVTPEAFSLLHEVAKKRLAFGRLTVIDATNIQSEARKQNVALAREYHCLPVAIVLNLPEKVCAERNNQRSDRTFGLSVLTRQSSQLKKSLRSLKAEGFRHIYVLESEAQISEVEITREPLWNNKKSEKGPFDIIGDIHGCYSELCALLQELGYNPTSLTHPEGRRAVFLGDLCDRGPDTPAVFRAVMQMVGQGSALCVPGNHDMKLMRALKGEKVSHTHGLSESISQLEKESEEFKREIITFIDRMVSHYVLDDGKLVVAHAGMKASMQGRGSGAVRSFALYGETTGEIDEFGLPVRLDWAKEYRGKAVVVFGHTSVPSPEWLNNTIDIDTGCVFGGRLTALRYPERQLVSVPAARVYCEPQKPLGLRIQENLSAQQQVDDLPPIPDLMGKRILETGLHGNLTIREEHSMAAMEVMSRFGADPKWLIYLPPTMAPPEASQRPDFLEHPEDVFRVYRKENVKAVVCEEKHMGSRAVVVVCKDREMARKRFGVTYGRDGLITTRTGRPFFDEKRQPGVEEALLQQLIGAAQKSGLWESLKTDWLCLDCEIMPWSVKAQELLVSQYAATGRAGVMTLSPAYEALERCPQANLPEFQALKERTLNRLNHVSNFQEAYSRYCWSVRSIQDIRLAPFHILASEGHVHHERDHAWHMEKIEALCKYPEEYPSLFATAYRIVNLDSESEVAATTEWWLKLTRSGGEGMVVKPLQFTERNGTRLIQPAMKCRGPEYLRLIYGPEYLLPENLKRLRYRTTNAKRSLAAREFALGIEGLKRFVGREPLRRVHECVLGVLALESEPVDPRL